MYYLSFNPSIKSLPSCTCLSLHKLSINPSVKPSVHYLIHLSINQSIRQTICPLPIYSSICLLNNPSVKPSVHYLIHLSINQSIHQTICPLPINLFIHSRNHHFYITFKIVSLILMTVL